MDHTFRHDRSVAEIASPRRRRRSIFLKMNMSPARPNSESLEDLRREIFSLLARAVADRRSPMRTPALATTDPAGRPSVRTVVLRAWDPARAEMQIHTDVRSQKVLHLSERPAAAMLFWDPGQRLQLRIDGDVRTSVDDAVAHVAWSKVPQAAQRLYGLSPAPGVKLGAPTDYRFSEEDAGANFCVLTVQVERLEALKLLPDGHQRAAFSWPSPSVCEASWLAP
ncbi:MAG: pyridoxamine 5'-phosphate oxidase family protein [Pseudomonadota bacterium]